MAINEVVWPENQKNILDTNNTRIENLLWSALTNNLICYRKPSTVAPNKLIGSTQIKTQMGLDSSGVCEKLSLRIRAV